MNLSPAVYLAALEAAKKVKQQTQFWIEQCIKDYLGASNPQVLAGPSDVPKSDDVVARPEEPASKETPRSSYSERREEQIDGGAKPIKLKERKYKIKVGWIKCMPDEFLDSENGAAQLPPFRIAKSSPTKFYAEADAREAVTEHFKQCGYYENIDYCSIHSCWHVTHAYSGVPQKEGAQAVA